MPTYEYFCESCSHTVDRFERMTPTPPVGVCPACNAKALVRKIGCGVIATARIKASNQYPYVSHSLPRKKLKGLPHDSHGRPIIESARVEREVMAGAYTKGEKYERE